MPIRPPPPRAPARRHRAARAWLAASAVGTSLCIAALLLGFFGRDPLVLESPEPGAVVGLSGIELLVNYRPDARVEASTLRVLLNGADVTDRLETARNGASGRLQGLLDGENRLRVEVFVRRPWLPGGWVESVREVPVLYRPPQDSDRG